MSHGKAAETPGKHGDSETRAALGAALVQQTPVSDPDLQSIIDAWATLPGAVKADTVAMVNANPSREHVLTRVKDGIQEADE